MFLANFLLALREGVEASLIVGILVAYLKKVGREDVLPKVWLGVSLAAGIPLAAGAYMTWGPYTLSFTAQEVIGGTLSLIAVAFVTWMVFWMGRNARTFTTSLRQAADKALQSTSSMAIVWLAVITVGREGIETALFVWATVKSSGETQVLAPALGVVSGLIVAVFIGYLVYLGSARINLKFFFNFTGYLLILVAAGVVAYGLGDLQEAQVLPGWGVWAYDFNYLLDGSVSSWLSVNTLWYTLLVAIFNANLSPTHLQLIGYFAYLIPALIAFTKLVVKPTRKPTLQPHPAPAAPTRSADTPVAAAPAVART